MTSRSPGEEAFAQAFQFAPIVPTSDHEELGDYLYKFSHNYDEAKEDLEVLKQVNAIGLKNESKLLPRVMSMSLQSYALDMRRMTDLSSRRSVRRLLNKVLKPELRAEEIAKLEEIHGHFSFYLNKGTAHQDEHSIKEVLEAYPDTETIEKDMTHLRELYLKIVKEICTSYIGIDSDPDDYSQELELLAQKSSK